MHQRLVGRAFDPGLGDQDAGGEGDDEGWHLADQTVADGHDGVGGRGLIDRQLVLHHPDQNAADDVDADDHQAGDGVAAHELGGAVHGAEEGGFLLQLLAAYLGRLLIDQARGQVGVDRHLLAGHGVEGEARRDFGDPARTLGDDHEIDQHQYGEDDDADDVVAAHHQLAEGLDDLAGPAGAFVAATEDQARGRQVQPQPE